MIVVRSGGIVPVKVTSLQRSVHQSRAVRHPQGIASAGLGKIRVASVRRSGMLGGSPMRLGTLLLVVGGLFTSCTGLKRAVNVPNSYRVIESGNPQLEARVRHHLDRFVFSRHFQKQELEFSGDVLVKTVPAIRKDRRGVPFWSPKNRTRDRSGGLTLFTGRTRPVIIIIAVMEDGAWDERTLKHECAHVVLLWNGIEGHPQEFARLVPLWN